jgi:uncharacterized tellurite resistance protein B-like protein
MLDRIKAFFAANIQATPDAGAAESVAAPDDAARIRLAACALLLELAHADGEFSAAERAHIESILERHFGLPPDRAAELMALAEEQRRSSIDHFQFTRLIAEHYDLGQKMVLAEVMWGLILADGQIADHESYLVRKIAYLLDLQPGYLAEARKAAARTAGSAE